VSATIIGPATTAQLTSTLATADLTLGDDILSELDGIFPPCGRAPEAYAW
jgi:aryl-alcohol dehydrogenase-like predicted oxidoreductase